MLKKTLRFTEDLCLLKELYCYVKQVTISELLKNYD
jgi:hypothetical protein